MRDLDKTQLVTDAASLPTIPGVELEGTLGRGGMGAVYWGTQAFVNRPVAVKMLEVQENDPHSLRQRFQLEARALANLDHSHIVQCYTAGECESGDAYIVMELVAGPNLSQYINKHGRLRERVALMITRDIAKALGYAHDQGIIHRDVKPANILLRPADSSGGSKEFAYRPKLADLGIAKFKKLSEDNADLEVTQENIAIGTPHYMAPEQHSAKTDIDFRADIFGLGCVLYCMLTAANPFVGDTPHEILYSKLEGTPDVSTKNPTVSPATVALLRKMMAPKPQHRHSSYEELINQCETALEELPLSSQSRKVRQLTHKKGALPLAGIAVLALAGIGIIGAAGYFAIFGGDTTAPAASNPTDAPVQTARIPASTNSAAPEMPEVSFSSRGELLFNDDFNARIADWNVEGSANWGPELEGAGINGVANGTQSGSLNYTLPGGPFRLTGEVATLGENDAEVHVDLANGEYFKLLIQNLGGGYLLRADHVAPDSRAELQVGAAKSISSNSAIFDIEFNGGNVYFRVGSELFHQFYATSQPERISLIAEEGISRYRDFQLFAPAN